MTTVLLVGATGVFGQRLARHLAGFKGIRLLLTSRDPAKAQALCRAIQSDGGAAPMEPLAFDKSAGFATLSAHRPWLVIDASGPFQQTDLSFPKAVLEAGAHYLDLADARDYLMDFAGLDAVAKARNLVALAGASSTPALSSAAVAEITRGWRRIDTVDIAITPGGKSDVGPAVLEAILIYAGTAIETFRNGQLGRVIAWSGSSRRAIPTLGNRRVAPVETADAMLLSAHFGIRSQVSFQAGLESAIEQWGLTFLAHLRRLGLVRSLVPLAPLLLRARALTKLFTQDRGAMLVEASGLDEAGRPVMAQWSLLAEKGHGPQVPTLPAAAAVRALLAGGLPAGARPCVDTLSLDAIEQEMKAYAIRTRQERTTLPKDSIFSLSLGDAYSSLPSPLKAFHDADSAPVWEGWANVEAGTSLPARVIQQFVDLPKAGAVVPVRVTVSKKLTSPSEPMIETWCRDFDGRQFRSVLRSTGNGEVTERFGPIRIRLAAAARAGTVTLPISGWSIFGVPMPRWLAPSSDASEAVDHAGRFRFDVRLALPGGALLAHYRGYLQPVKHLDGTAAGIGWLSRNSKLDVVSAAAACADLSR